VPGILNIHLDGASLGNPGPAGIGLVLRPEGGPAQEIAEAIGQATSHQADYRALLRALHLARDLGHTRVHIYSDNPLMMRQMNGESRVRDPLSRPLFREAMRLTRELDVRFNKVTREANRQADQLARRAARGQAPPPPPIQEPPPDQPKEGRREAVQRSAGGVVYKKEGRALKVCLIAKRGGLVWALPKGRVNPGETSEEAAIREILEETGHLAAIAEQIDHINYDFYWKENRTLYHKVVVFYLMPLVQEAVGPRDDEADAVGWFTLGEACRKLSYLNEKKVLHQARRILQMTRA
jgi:ribonuclease HI/8-oxo-dGTP pyrophosphatase MutT (NUDIX family)